jgi:hypothetical protein
MVVSGSFDFVRIRHGNIACKIIFANGELSFAPDNPSRVTPVPTIFHFHILEAQGQFLVNGGQ